jgi:hypothetical protein
MEKDNVKVNPGCVGVAGCLVIFLIIGVVFFNAWIFELLWNWLMPSLLNLPAVTYWQSFGIMIFLHLVGGWLFASNKES